MNIRPKYFFFLFSLMFVLYSFSIYLKPVYLKSEQNQQVKNGPEGRLIWQKYNCQACHQLYGLGGYLGPDLTNILSQPGKSQNYVRGILSGGTKQMPAFSINDHEFSQLIEFLKMTDASGVADPRSFKTEMNGMISAQ